jgi:hypothetical protein
MPEPLDVGEDGERRLTSSGYVVKLTVTAESEGSCRLPQLRSPLPQDFSFFQWYRDVVVAR